MDFIGCSGFPVPVSRYWEEFPSVEISETELGIPGAGTVRRWLREAPEGFGFCVLAPKEIASSAFARTPENDAALKSIQGLAKTLSAHAIVFVASPEFAPTRAHKAAVKDFFENLPARYPRVVVDLPSWKADEVRNLLKNTKAKVAYDPLHEEAPADKDFVYQRLPGPAGHRSRYDENLLDRVAEHFEAAKAKLKFCVFRNIDMYANAKRTHESLEELRTGAREHGASRPST